MGKIHVIHPLLSLNIYMPVFLLLLYYLSVEGFVSISKDEQCLDSVGGDKYGKNN